MKALKTLAAAALLASTSYAFAIVTFDPATGAGFVGKGDVQLAFGWNNQQLQTNAGGVSFSYSVTQAYTAVCTWVTGEGTRGEQTHNVNHTESTQVNDVVAFDARSRTQITGFTLKGFGTTTSVGTEPRVGDPCPGNEGTDGTWSSVTPNGAPTGGLFVNYGTSSALLTITP